MLDTEHILSTLKCKFISKKCYSVDCCFLLGWWVQCHVLCQQWCCACWCWWHTESYEAWCSTGDTELGLVNYIFKRFVQLLLKIALQYCSVILTILHTYTHTRLTAFCQGLPGWPGTRKVQEAQLSPSDRAMRLVSSNLANCHANNNNNDRLTAFDPGQPG